MKSFFESEGKIFAVSAIVSVYPARENGKATVRLIDGTGIDIPAMHWEKLKQELSSELISLG